MSLCNGFSSLSIVCLQIMFHFLSPCFLSSDAYCNKLATYALVRLEPEPLGL